MELGVNTHFDQGWPVVAMEQITVAGADGLRDTISWGKVEKSLGHYEFTPANSGYIETACKRGLRVLLTLTPRNRLYENGETVTSPEGRIAFAHFAATLAERYSCIAAFEIGNEINGHSLKGRILDDMPRSYVAIVAAVRAAVKPHRPDIAILSGSSLSVATGFFARLAGAGLLPLVDGIVVHPYPAVPEQLPEQLARLNGILTASAQGAKPVWASEFGFYYPTPDAAPSHALKMIAILDAAGIKRADWYALRDEPWYPNMGLFARTGGAKPALDTFRLATGKLLPAGPAHRIDMGDPLSFVYRFGNGPYVLWGSERTVRFQGAARAWDARGTAVALPSSLGEHPIVVDAPGGLELGPQRVLADSLLAPTAPGWSRFVSSPQRQNAALDWIDWNWSPYQGTRAFPNFRAMGNIVTTARGVGPAASLIERFAPAKGGRLTITLCLESAPNRPQTVALHAGGRAIWSQTTGNGPIKAVVPAEIAAGETIDLSVTAQSPGAPQPLNRRIRIFNGTATGEPLCAPAKGDGERPNSPQGGPAPEPA